MIKLHMCVQAVLDLEVFTLMEKTAYIVLYCIIPILAAITELNKCKMCFNDKYAEGEQEHKRT